MDIRKKFCIGIVLFLLVCFLFKPENKDWVDVLGALGPIVVAALVGYVAFQQYLIEKYKKRTMFHTEQSRAVEDLYNLVLEALAITDEEISSSVDNLKDSKRGVLLQRFFLLNIRFKTLFGIKDVLNIRNLFEDRNMARLFVIRFGKLEDCKTEVLENSRKSVAIEIEIEELHSKIQEEVDKIINISSEEKNLNC